MMEDGMEWVSETLNLWEACKQVPPIPWVYLARKPTTEFLSIEPLIEEQGEERDAEL
jgi:hypothetical protein